jgi:hypothetical protein
MRPETTEERESDARAGGGPSADPAQKSDVTTDVPAMVMVSSYGVSPGGPQRGGARRVLRRPLCAPHMFARRFSGFGDGGCPRAGCVPENIDCTYQKDETARHAQQHSLHFQLPQRDHMDSQFGLRPSARASRSAPPPAPRTLVSYTPMLVLAFPLEPCTPGFHATGHITHTSGRSITVGHVRSNMGPMPSTHCGASTG